MSGFGRFMDYRNRQITDLFVLLSCMCKSSSTDELILMELYTLVVYNLTMCMEEDDHVPNYLREIIGSV